MRTFIMNLSYWFFIPVPSFVRVFIWDLFSPFGQKLFSIIRYGIARNELLFCGQNVYFGKNITIKNWNKISLGNNVSVHDSCYVNGAGGISIGSNVAVAHLTSIMSSEHGWTDNGAPIKYNKGIFKAVHIESDVWIGCGVRILSGALIEGRSVVAAGSVILGKNYPSHGLYAGVPAARKKDLPR